MKQWFTTLLLILGLASGVVAGMPLHSDEMNGGKMMDCCDKAKRGDTSRAATMLRLCCALHCSDPGPTAPSGSQSNYSPSTVIASDVVGRQIADFLEARHAPKQLFLAAVFEFEQWQSPPKYIKLHSFRI